MEAQAPGLPQRRIFRSQAGLARRLEEHEEPLAAVRTPGSARPLPAAVKANFPSTRRAPLREALAFFVALVFPLLFRPVSFSQVAWIFVWFLEIFPSPLSVWVSACSGALILVKRRAWASPVA